MQGTFERLPPGADSNSENTSEGGRVRLDAMANVPWRNLEPANDKATQRQMNKHYATERIYQAANARQKRFLPRVAPYPETPDEVFPGCPHYRIVVDGVSRFVFVIESPSWPGNYQPQSAARWAVPHFVFRDERLVSSAKERYKFIYEQDAIAGLPPPNKWDFDSNPVHPLPPLVIDPKYGAVSPNDSYYVYGTPNTNLTAPEIQDPLFDAGFNPRAAAGGPMPFAQPLPIMVRPWPYKQPASRFPRQPPPPAVYQMVPGPPPAPAPAP